MKKLLFVLDMLVATGLAYAQGTLVLDQQATTLNFASGGAQIQNQQPMGQSFTPSLSAVGYVQFQFLDSTGNQGATVYVNLLANSTTGNVLATSSPVYMPNGYFGTTNFFFASNIPIQAGVEYFFLPVLQSGDNIDLLGGSLNYQGGSAFFNGQPNTSGTDFWFREGIVVPEPATGAFLIGGALAVFFTLRRRSQ